MVMKKKNMMMMVMMKKTMMMIMVMKKEKKKMMMKRRPKKPGPHFVRACAIEMHVNMWQETSEEPLYTDIGRKNLAAQIEPRTQTHTLCEPEQSKCMSTFHKRHQKSRCIRTLTGKMPRPRLSPECRHTHFVRACAVATHVNISQETSEEPLYRRMFRSQTFDNMDRWKSRGGKGQRREEKKKEDQKRKSQKKEDAGARKGRKVAKHCVFLMICGSGGSESRLAKAAGAEPAGQMKAEKLHAVVARSTFRSLQLTISL